MGYGEGKRRKIHEALLDTVRALDALKDDPSVLNNAGQLIAWHDLFGESVAIPDSARETMEKLQKELSANDAFAKAYARIKADFDKEQDRKADVNKKIKDAEAAVEAAEGQAKTMLDNLRRIEEIAKGKAVSDLEHNNAARKDVEQAQKERDQARADLPGARAKCQAAVADGQTKAAAVADLKKQLSKTVDLSFRWDPPAVDGVVTPEAVGRPSATTGPSQPALPEDAEAKAAQRLAIAKNYISNKMNDKAVVLLEEILQEYGKTKAAREAAELLKNVPRGD
jgi:chromosome segregation ATPase